VKPMPWWKRWPNRVHLAFTGLKYRLARFLHRAGLLPSTQRATTDTMGDWKRLQAMADDPKPRLVSPPDGPYADLIRRVRLYAQNGAKALAPLLDRPLPTDWYANDPLRPARIDEGAVTQRMIDALALASRDGDAAGQQLVDELATLRAEAIRAIHAAYNSPWTAVDGEVFEVVTERAKEEVIQ